MKVFRKSRSYTESQAIKCIKYNTHSYVKLTKQNLLITKIPRKVTYTNTSHICIHKKKEDIQEEVRHAHRERGTGCESTTGEQASHLTAGQRADDRGE